MASIFEGFSLSHAQILDGGTRFIDAVARAALESEDIYGVNEASLDPDTGDFDNEGDDAVLSTWSWFNFADVAVQAGYLSFPLYANMTGQPVDTVTATTGASEVQSVGPTAATAGTFTLSFDGEETTALSFDAAAVDIEAALIALPGLADGDVTATGGPANTAAVELTFGGNKAEQDVPQIVADSTNLTGGTISVTTTTEGAATLPESVGADLWHEDSMNVAPKPMLVKMPAKDDTGAVGTLALGLYRVQFKPITFDGPAYKDGLKINYNGRAVMSNTDELGGQFPDGKKRVGRVLAFTATV